MYVTARTSSLFPPLTFAPNRSIHQTAPLTVFNYDIFFITASMAQGQGGNNFNNQQNFQNQNQNQNHNQNQDSKPQMRGGAIKDEHATLKEKVREHSCTTHLPPISTLFLHKDLRHFLNYHCTSPSILSHRSFYHTFYSFDVLSLFSPLRCFQSHFIVHGKHFQYQYPAYCAGLLFC
jgi:hypothetical protein